MSDSGVDPWLDPLTGSFARSLSPGKPKLGLPALWEEFRQDGGPGSGQRLQRSVYYRSDTVRHLNPQSLRGHMGCVNRIAWNETGTKLLSGSDDLTLGLWSFPMDTHHIIQTGHSANIFGVRFLPDSNDAVLVSGAMDNVVLVTQVERNLELRRYEEHQDRVKTVEVVPGNGNIVLSASEDGSVHRYDLRCTGSQGRGSSYDVVAELRTNPADNLECKSALINPVRHHELLVAASDPYLRMYDLRKIQRDPFRMLVPERFRDIAPNSASNATYPTYASFSRNGNRVTSSYSGDLVYVFDLDHSLPATASTKMDTVVSGISRCSDVAVDGLTHAVSVYLAGEGHLLTSITALSDLIRFYPDWLTPHIWRVEMLLARDWAGDSTEAFQDIQRCLDRLEELPSGLILLLETAKAYAALKFIDPLSVHFTRDPLVTELLRARLDDVRRSIQRLRVMASKVGMDQGSLLSTEEMNLSIAEYIGKHRKSQVESIRTTLTSLEEKAAMLEREVDEMEEQCARSDDAHRQGSSTPSRPLIPRQRSRIYSQQDLWGKMLKKTHFMRYFGSINAQTDIKEANFFGVDDQFVMAGSDGGLLFLWETNTGRVVRHFRADSEVTNCCQGHPSQFAIASSGIDSDIKIWETSGWSEHEETEDEEPDRAFYSELPATITASQQRTLVGRRGLTYLNLLYGDEFIPQGILSQFLGVPLGFSLMDQQHTRNARHQSADSKEPQCRVQ